MDEAHRPSDPPPTGPHKGEVVLERLQVGDKLGNFRITRCLCEGLLANYYSVEHAFDKHEATIGVLHRRISRDEAVLKRLVLLQKKLKILEHESIPQIEEVAKVDGHLCLFMGPVGGQALGDYFSEKAVPGDSGLEPIEMKRLLAQLLGILGFAHSRDLDHRDLESNLIFIQADGSLRVLGLGLKAAIGIDLFEEVVSASVSPLDQSRLAGRLTSFDVMSPEYRAGIDEEARADIFGIGAIGYWLLTGHKPDMAHYRSPSGLVGSTAASLDPIFEKALSRERDSRYQSCRSMLLAMQETEERVESGRADYIQRQIDRIPVPRGVRARGALATRTYRLSVIGLLGVSLVALAAQFMLSVFVTKDVPTEEVARRTLPGESPRLQIRVQPLGAKVVFAEGGQSFFTNDGQLALDLRPGTYNLEVSSPGHIGVRRTVTITKDRERVEQLFVTLRPDLVEATLVSQPQADIFLIDAVGERRELGRTDAGGSFALSIPRPKGAYSIEVEKEGYRSARIDGTALAALKPNEARIEQLLEALPASVRVTTDPEGAEIFVEGQSVGTSPVVVERAETEASFEVIAQLAGYRPTSWTLRLRPGEEAVLDFGELVPRSAELRVEVLFEGLDMESAAALRPQVQIMIDDKSYSLDHPALQSVPEGLRRIRAEHPLYLSDLMELELVDGQVVALDLELRPRPGYVDLSLPAGLQARAFADGERWDIKDGRLELPALRDLSLELHIQDHLTMVRRVRLEPAQTIQWEARPVRIPGPDLGAAWTVPYLGLQMGWVPPGRYVMGSPLPEQGRLPNEGDATPVTFTQGFWAGVHEVTQGEYQRVMGENPSAFPDERQPVESVTWSQASAFCQRLTESERRAGRLPQGYIYRLPTEAEWEYAARAGSQGPFHFGEVADASMGNFQGVYPRDFQSDFRRADQYGPMPVGAFEPNALGLHDVHGNVAEWTADAYNGRLPGVPLADPEPRVGSDRFSVRGGSWASNASRARSAVRESIQSEIQSHSIGFRVFLAPAPESPR